MGILDLLDEYGRPVGVTPAGAMLAPRAGPVIPPMPEHRGRSGKWPRFLRELLAAHPNCRGCGRKAETGHHLVPFHERPDLELEPANVVPVCVPCHFVVCHGSSWNLTIPTAAEDLDYHRKRVDAARGRGSARAATRREMRAARALR